jgi:sec-independent protein translocase protein TatB
MFDIGWGELVVIGVVALIAIGPKELPGVLRTTGQWMGKIRRMASDFQDQFKEALREAELDDLKKKVDEMTDTAKSYTNFDPIGTVRNEIDKMVGDPLSLDSKPAEPEPEASPAESNSTEVSSAEAPPAHQPQPAVGRKAGEEA